MRGLSASVSFLPLSLPPLSLFGSRFISRAVKTESPLPRYFFAPKPNGNACYAGYVLGGTDLVACCFRFFSPSPKHVCHRRLSCLILCLSSTVLHPYIAVLFLRGPSSRGSSVYTKTPMYGSQTPMYGSQTPMHGSRTPMYGSQTPTHGDGKTAL